MSQDTQAADLLELFFSILQPTGGLHLLVPALHYLTPQRCDLVVTLQLTHLQPLDQLTLHLQPLDQLTLLVLALVQCSSKLQYVLHHQ